MDLCDNGADVLQNCQSEIREEWEGGSCFLFAIYLYDMIKIQNDTGKEKTNESDTKRSWGAKSGIDGISS